MSLTLVCDGTDFDTNILLTGKLDASLHFTNGDCAEMQLRIIDSF